MSTLNTDIREGILTKEIINRTRSGKAELLATKPGKAYFAINGGVDKWWPVRLTVTVLWVIAALGVWMFTMSIIGFLIFAAAIWWTRLTLPSIQVVQVGEFGEVAVSNLYWGAAFKLDESLRGY